MPLLQLYGISLGTVKFDLIYNELLSLTNEMYVQFC